MAQAAIRPEANAPEHVRDATAARTATLAAAFDRVARTLRRTILLAHHLDQPARPDLRTQARTRVIRTVENAIDYAAYAGRAPDQDAVRREMLERIDSPAFDDDLATRPLADLVKELCQDLGIYDNLPFTCPPRRRAPAEVAAVHTEAQAQPGTLHTGPPTTRPPEAPRVAIPAPAGPGPRSPRPPPAHMTAEDLEAILGPPGRRSG